MRILRKPLVALSVLTPLYVVFVVLFFVIAWLGQVDYAIVSIPHYAVLSVIAAFEAARRL